MQEVIDFSFVLFNQNFVLKCPVEFTQDLETIFVVVIVQDHLQFCRIMTLQWQAKSTDLPPTKHVWKILGRHVWRCPHKPKDINELADAFQEEWNQIP